jgi:Xaa-Pro aminopeptidase
MSVNKVPERIFNLPITVARRMPDRTIQDTGSMIDMRAMRSYRLSRVRDQLKRQDIAAALLFDPVNLRYATGAGNMPVFRMHFPKSQYCFIPVEGPVILFDSPKFAHGVTALETIDELRPPTNCRETDVGRNAEENVARWADEIADLILTYGGGNRRIALDRCEPAQTLSLAARDIAVLDAQVWMEYARSIKSKEEVNCMSISIAVCEVGASRIRDAVEPGVTENELWALMAHANIAMGGEWLECRLLTSGGRTNPWLQEASDRMVRAGELVAFDTDVVGPFGYCADFSRTFFCEPGRPSDNQRKLYGLAYEEVHHNMSLIRAGVGFQELAEKAYKVPEIYSEQAYDFVAHGVGMCDEWPNIYPLKKLQELNVDGVIEEGMVLAVESYMGEAGGPEGVKLETQVLVTETGVEWLDTFPFEENLLGREI